MAEPVTLEELRLQTKVDANDENALLEGLIVSARRAIENRTGRTIVGETPTLSAADMPVVRQAILMLAAYWYSNRETAVAGMTTTEMPMTVEYLIGPISRLAV